MSEEQKKENPEQFKEIKLSEDLSFKLYPGEKLVKVAIVHLPHLPIEDQEQACILYETEDKNQELACALVKEEGLIYYTDQFRPPNETIMVLHSVGFKFNTQFLARMPLPAHFAHRYKKKK